ncbi:MAG: hypothetical protein WC310_03380 [Patescibacteria group bacterium]
MSTPQSQNTHKFGILIWDKDPSTEKKFNAVVKRNLPRRFGVDVTLTQAETVSSLKEKVNVFFREGRKVLVFISVDDQPFDIYRDVIDLVDIRFLSKWELVVISGNSKMQYWADRLGVRFLSRLISPFQLSRFIVTALKIEGSGNNKDLGQTNNSSPSRFGGTDKNKL